MAKRIRNTQQSEIVELSSDDDQNLNDHITETRAAARRLANAHVDLYTDLHPTMRPFFEDFIFEHILIDNPSFSKLQDIERPSNSLETDVAQILHWPPKQPGLKACGSIVENLVSPSIAWLRSVFKDFNKATVFDLIPQRMYVYDTEGKRRRVERLYPDAKVFQTNLNFAETLVRNLQCTKEEGHILLYGGHVRAWWEITFGTADNILIDGKKWILHFIYHPEHLIRWASKQRRLAVKEELEAISKAADIALDSGYLQKFASHDSESSEEPLSNSLQGENEDDDTSPPPSYVNLVKLANHANKIMSTKSTSDKFKKYWMLVESKKQILEEYSTEVSDHYSQNKKECNDLVQTQIPGGKGSHIIRLLQRLSQVVTEEELQEAKRDLTSHLRTPEAKEKIRDTMLYDNDFRTERWGERNAFDEENHVICYGCNHKYIDLTALKHHWRTFHIGEQYFESKVERVGNFEYQWACYFCYYTARMKPTLHVHIKKTHSAQPDDNSMLRKLVPLEPVSQWPQVFGNMPADTRKRENPGNKTVVLWPCYVEECDRICYDRSALNIHFHNKKDHKSIKWCALTATENTTEFKLKYDISNFKCYMDQCKGVLFKDLEIVINHFNHKHKKAKLDLTRLIEVAARDDADYDPSGPNSHLGPTGDKMEPRDVVWDPLKNRSS